MPKLKTEWLEEHGCRLVKGEYTDDLGDVLLIGHELASASYGGDWPRIGGWEEQGPATEKDWTAFRRRVRNRKLARALAGVHDTMPEESSYHCDGDRCGVLLGEDGHHYLNDTDSRGESIGPLCDSCWRSMRCIGRDTGCPYDAERTVDKLCARCASTTVDEVQSGYCPSADDIQAHLGCCEGWAADITAALPKTLTKEQAAAYRSVCELGAAADASTVWQGLERLNSADAKSTLWRALKVLSIPREMLVSIGAQLEIIPRR